MLGVPEEKMIEDPAVKDAQRVWVSFTPPGESSVLDSWNVP